LAIAVISARAYFRATRPLVHQEHNIMSQDIADIGHVEKSDEDWQQQLTPEQFHVTRKKGTERAFTGEYWDEHRDGVYKCVCCGLPLFDSRHKFESGTGWPSFYQPFDPEHINELRDASHGMVRTEVRCRRCDAHLGHVFDDGPPPTHQRYCLNSVSMEFFAEGTQPQQHPAQ